MQVSSATDYHPFGWEMPGRKYNSSEYRYGFNGKEKDQDGEFGSITNYDYGFRIYNPATGRFLSVDPLTREYSMLTPYQFASNRPIDGIDIDGLEYFPRITPDGKREIVIKLKIAFQDNNTTTRKERESFARGLEKLMREGMSGYLVDNTYLTINPILTVVTSNDVDFNEDYHIEMVTSDHTQLKDAGASGRTFSKKRAIIAYHDEFESEIEGFILPNGDVQPPEIVNELVLSLYSDYTALHEVGHMLGIAHTFPRFVNDKGEASWKSLYLFIKSAPKDVRDVWEKARGGDQEAIKKLSNLFMNYREGEANVPKGAGVKNTAIEMTKGQRTQIWNTAVQDERERNNTELKEKEEQPD